jgi:hypothetical protein
MDPLTINMYALAERLGCSPPDLITRPAGRDVYGHLKRVLNDLGDGGTMVLDFSGVKVIDSSFIDEMLVNILLEARQSPKVFYIKLKNFSEIAEINIDLVLRSYSLYKNKKIVVITENICHNNAFYIGPLTDLEKDIVEYLRINKSATPEEISRFSGLPSQEAERILEELHAARAVRKDNAGNFLPV